MNSSQPLTFTTLNHVLSKNHPFTPLNPAFKQPPIINPYCQWAVSYTSSRLLLTCGQVSPRRPFTESYGNWCLSCTTSSQLWWQLHGNVFMVEWPLEPWGCQSCLTLLRVHQLTLAEMHLKLMPNPDDAHLSSSPKPPSSPLEANWFHNCQASLSPEPDALQQNLSNLISPEDWCLWGMIFLFLLLLYHSLQYLDGWRKQYEKMVICFQHLTYLQLLQEKPLRVHGQILGIRYFSMLYTLMAYHL